jgi:hypothetical protein
MSLTAYGEEHDGVLQPLNATYLSGKPYYCETCGLGMPEYLACEDGECSLELPSVAQERLRKAHAEGKGMPQP